MLVPALLLFSLFMVYPFILSVRISLFDWQGLGPIDHFVGLQNFITTLTKAPSSDRFWNALNHNFFLFLASTLTLQVPAVGLALILATISGRTAGTLRVLYLLPWAIAPVVVAILWQRLLFPGTGLVDGAFTAVGLPAPQIPFLGDPTLALPTIVLIASWQVIGFNALIYLSAILAIPRELSEAARVDGAGVMRTARSLTLPLIRSTIITMVGLQIIAAFSTFELIYLIEGSTGGPFFTTDVTSVLMYRTGFGGFGASSVPQFGMASSIATLAALAVIPTSIVVIRLRNRWHVSY